MFLCSTIQQTILKFNLKIIDFITFLVEKSMFGFKTELFVNCIVIEYFNHGFPFKNYFTTRKTALSQILLRIFLGANSAFQKGRIKIQFLGCFFSYIFGTNAPFTITKPATACLSFLLNSQTLRSVNCRVYSILESRLLTD